MGVEATIERAFEEAGPTGEPGRPTRRAKDRGARPARRPAATSGSRRWRGILDGSIKIHCHCYRSDEILMLLRIAERYGVRVQSLQHVLEGYKVAPEIAAHGASASTFSDWWAYKVEAYDAIPFNAALLTQAGVRVCIKSDSEELIRHLNLEAAKMVKYGGVTEAQALAMITINPARELGLDDRLGSIEVGKDADIALFNAHPFDAFARCELALIDGEVWFQRRARTASSPPRPGDHARCPRADADGAGQDARDRRRSPRDVYALIGATAPPGQRPRHPERDARHRRRQDRRDRRRRHADPRRGRRRSTCSGLDVWPGLIDAGTPLGLYEIGSLSETQDYADSAQFQPELRTSTALHPDSELIPVTRANGVLTAYVQPTGGLISGQGCVIDLDGWVPREMVVADPRGAEREHPRVRPAPERRVGPRPGRRPERRPGPAARRARSGSRRSSEQFRRRLGLRQGRRPRPRPARRRRPPPDPRLAALVPYARGEKPVIFRAEHRDEILDALKIADELKLKAVISGGADAWKVADALKAANVPVLVGGTLRFPREPTDPYDAAYANPARLHEAGVTFAIRSKAGGPDAGDRRAEPPVRGRDGRRLRPARGRGAEGRHARPGRRSWAWPTRSARSRSASGPTSSSPPATSSSRRPRSRRCSSTASPCRPRAATPGSTPSIAAASPRSGPGPRRSASTSSPRVPRRPPPAPPSPRPPEARGTSEMTGIA